jgi:hypothetical protein
MEADANMRTMGKKWSDSEFAANVACAMVAHVRHKTPLPAWAIAWADQHEALDKKRKQKEANRKAEEKDYKLRRYNKLKKELGL